jgi:hypothetical protein
MGKNTKKKDAQGADVQKKAAKHNARQIEIWKANNPNKKMPVIQDPEKIIEMLKKRKEVLSQPLDLVHWNKDGKMIPGRMHKRNPQLGAIICRWVSMFPHLVFARNLGLF